MASDGDPNAPLTMDEAAARLRVSRRWLHDFLKLHPHYRLKGNRKLFTEGDIALLLEAMKPPRAEPRYRSTARRFASNHDAGGGWEEALKLATSGKRRPTSKTPP